MDYSYLTHESRLSDNGDFPFWTPGWTDYNKTIQYYKADVTDVLRAYKQHTIGMVVGPGWYSGYIGGKYNSYGNVNSGILELHIEFDSGSTVVIVSDETWKVNTGEILYSDSAYGELIYENKVLNKWTHYDYNDRNWSPVVTQLVDKNIEFIEDTFLIKNMYVHFPRSYKEVGQNTWIYSFDELIYGGVNIRLNDFKSNVRLQVRFGESLYPSGSLYTGNDGTALIGNTYVLNGKLTILYIL